CRGPDAVRDEADPRPGRDTARNRAAAARRGPAAAQRPWPRRHPLPAADRRAALAQPRAARSGRRAGRGHGRQPARAAAEREEAMMAEDRARGVFMISVAAELAGMHPQTLRIYETRGLITPQRSPKN